MKIEDVQIGQFGIARGSWPADCVVFPSQRKLVSVDRCVTEVLDGSGAVVITLEPDDMLRLRGLL